MKFLLPFLISLTIANISVAQKSISLPLNATPLQMLGKIFDGKHEPSVNGVKWQPTAADLAEFNGTLGDGYLYSVVDKFVKEGNSQILIFHTSSFSKDDDGKFTDANSCHACGTTFGYAVFETVDDQLVLTTLKRAFAVRGSFGASNYKVYYYNLGNGYNIIRIDDTYDGMGISSTSTSLYSLGNQVLSMVSTENNKGSKGKSEKGYYEFKTSFVFSTKNQTITATQTGYRINEATGKKELTNKKKIWSFIGNTLEF